MVGTYDNLKAEVLRLRQEGKLDSRPTAEERADWAYGTTKIENDAVTRKMATEAVNRKDQSAKVG